MAREPGLDLGMFVGGVIAGDQVYQNDAAIAERRSSRLHPRRVISRAAAEATGRADRTLLRASLRHRWDAPHASARPHQYPQAPADSCGGLQSRTRHAPPDRHRHAARAAGSPGDRHGRAFGAPGRYPTLAGRDFPMAPTHRGCALVSVTDHHHRQLLSADHLHHGLLSRILTQEDPVPVWPFDRGPKRGYAFMPLYKRAPEAALKDEDLYQLLALVDAIRDGSARERELAKRELSVRLKGSL